jgi:hypothetical protein
MWRLIGIFVACNVWLCVFICLFMFVFFLIFVFICLCDCVCCVVLLYCVSMCIGLNLLLCYCTEYKRNHLKYFEMNTLINSTNILTIIIVVFSGDFALNKLHGMGSAAMVDGSNFTGVCCVNM